MANFQTTSKQISEWQGRDFNHLREHLTPLLEIREWSVEKLANELTKAGFPLTRTAVYLWFKDTTKPNPQTALGISMVLGVPLEEVLAQYTPRKHPPIRHPDRVKFIDIKNFAQGT